MSDISASRDLHQTLNSLLSECVFGSVPYKLKIQQPVIAKEIVCFCCNEPL